MKNIFIDATNRVADYICGTYADFNYLDGTVTRDKQCKIIEDVISDNDNIIGIIVREKKLHRYVIIKTIGQFIRD